MTNTTNTPASIDPGAWSPFRHSAFTLLWLATLVSNIGTWMHDVGAGWLMTELSPSPFVVAAVQAATTLPIFLFALPAGALADIVDRRRLLIAVNLFLGAVAALLAFLVSRDAVTPALLLTVTFAMGTGVAIMAPAWQAVVPQLVPREELTSAVALNSMGINISRTIGPALAGFLIVAYGMAVPFVLNALSIIGIVAALLWWRAPTVKQSKLPPETIVPAMISGVRYTLHSGPVKSTLLRAFAFFVFGSAFWALLPLVARNVLAGGASLYGILLGCLGTGAVAGAIFLPLIKSRIGADGAVILGTVGLSFVMTLIALAPNSYVAAGAAIVAGVSWIAVMSTLNVSAQTALPNWARARGLSIFLMVFYGSMTVGSLLWGHLASQVGIPAALATASAGAIIAMMLTRGAKLNQGESMDLTPSMHWPEPVIDPAHETDRGPVMIQIVYDIDTNDRAKFIELMGQLAQARHRNGGYGWSLMEDLSVPNRFVETWQEASWLQHLRHHEHVSADDRAVQQKIWKLNRSGETSAAHLMSVT
ncbi:Predicted arabinose efflux permease, MFS family [Filomicrobium insigne]|uniref:Predicted arabinose efflux permease, MFS family n=1 Tax=Filomicrobium insigne TaxID=418854 RepID=A0A1H0UJX3_9HYPH|nr:MFS transporter [Filomicrobium insigne]SDP66527.1 Predicted arabinose efflux permease, MFS family [Filomicrobium insigne]